jgi:hypothetical protein
MYLPRISAHAVELINKCEARNTITFHLSVDCKSLTLHTRYAAYDKDSAVQNSEGALHFDCEVDMPWSNKIVGVE